MQRSHSQEDGWKFWVGLIISNVPIIVILAMMMTFLSTDSDTTFIALGYLLPTAVGVGWAVVDSISKKPAWFVSY